jgi:hypothetical protein
MRAATIRRNVLAALVLAAGLLADAAPVPAWDDSFIKSKKKDAAKEEPDDGLKPFDDLTKGCERVDGLFPIWRNRDLGKLWMEVAPEQLDRSYICSLTREAAEGTFFDNSAMMTGYLFQLHREGKKLHWLRMNVAFRSPGDSAFARAIERGVSHSVIGVLEIASRPHEERKSILVDPTSFFLRDHGGVAAALRESEAGYSLDKDASYVDGILNFPKNTEIEAVLNFVNDAPKVPVPTVPDARSFRHRYHWSLTERPGPGYVPRLADDRVGHFLTMTMDYSNTRAETPYVRVIDRWRLEKQDPAAAVSPPKEPIVYWLENTVPPEYRAALTRGLLSWNKAFEKAGFKDAVVVKQMPDTASWDPADVRYHVVRWMLQPGGSYAVGPRRVDPQTGEIFDADIRISADIARVVYREWNDQVFPIAEGIAKSQDECRYAEGLAQQAAFGSGLLEARGLFDPDSPEGTKYLEQYLEGLVCHEVGHTLGLRHNFKSSVINSLDQLQDVNRTRDHGITGSIMDYAPVNLAREGEAQGDYWSQAPGVYDVWAIEYAYTPFGASSPGEEREALEKIASRSSDPLLAYGTDEDGRGFDAAGIDPTVTLWDLGDDPLAWAEVRMDLSRELWSKMDGYLAKPGQRFPRYRSVYGQGLSEIRTAGMTAAKYVGGIYHRRDHVGDPGGRLPFDPVPAATQRKALRLLADRIFSEDAFSMTPDLLNKLAPERFPTLDGAVWSASRIDYPFHGIVLQSQAVPLDMLLDPVRLSRIQDAELRFAEGEEPFRMIELFTALRESIWSELAKEAAISSVRRNLQRAHLNRLILMATVPVAGTPEDAVTLARADLKWIARGCDRRLAKAGADAMTRAHLEETRDRIGAALEASLTRPLPAPGAGPTM